jgi:threonylcarbamoyladenosine tRNA methylthiotransferase MtaB
VGLLNALGAVDGLERIRLSSLESAELRLDVLDALRRSAKFVPHFHLPLQSGSNSVLARMNRRYTKEAFLRGLDEIRKRWDEPSITTDIIVGFPQETDAEFDETLETSRQARFSRLHVFSYSDRPGTPACSLEPKVPERTLKSRRQRLLDVGRELAHNYALPFLGRTITVIAEARRDKATGHFLGYSEHYLRVLIDVKNVSRGEKVQLQVTQVFSDGTVLGAARGTC